MALKTSVLHKVLRLTVLNYVGSASAKVPSSYEKSVLTLRGRGDKIVRNGREEVVLKVGTDPKLNNGFDIHVNDPFSTVSRLHGFFMFKQGRFFYFDYNSTNGSMIDGKIVKGGSQARGKEIAKKLVKIQLGKWNPSENKTSYHPVVEITAIASDKVEGAAVLSVAEVTLSYDIPGAQMKEFFILQVLDNNFLTLHKVQNSARKFMENKHEILVGREVGSHELAIPESASNTVSGIHGVFTCKDGFLYYRDLGTSFGSYLNHIRIGKEKEVIPRGKTEIGLGEPKGSTYPVVITIELHLAVAGEQALPVSDQRAA